MSKGGRDGRLRKRVWAGLAISLRQVIMLVMAVGSLYPLYFIFVNAFKTKVEYAGNKSGLPHHLVGEAFSKVFQGPNFARWFGNSLLLTFGSVLISLFIGAMAAYAMSRMRFRGQGLLLNGIVTLMVIPPIVMVIPLFVLMSRVNLINSYPAPILIYTGLLLPFTIYLLYSFFVTVPQAIVDSAMIDGCSNLQTFLRIILPLSRPALVTLIVVNALWVWNEILVALIFLQKEELRTIMVGLTVFRGRFSVDVPVIMAGLVVASLPMLLMYIFGQRYLVKGLVAGSLKGE